MVGALAPHIREAHPVRSGERREPSSFRVGRAVPDETGSVCYHNRSIRGRIGVIWVPSGAVFNPSKRRKYHTGSKLVLWSGVTIAIPWKSLGQMALCGQVFAVQSDQRLEILGNCAHRETRGVGAENRRSEDAQERVRSSASLPASGLRREAAAQLARKPAAESGNRSVTTCRG